MSILDKLHNIISEDTAKLFHAAKSEAVKASHEVDQLKAQLAAAHQKAIEAATAAKAHAEAAAEKARAAVAELEIEAKAAAEKIAFHSAQLEPKDPTL